MTKSGAIAGMISGGLTSVLWPLLGKSFSNVAVFGLYEIIPGFLIATLFVYIFSKKTSASNNISNVIEN